MTTTRLDPPHVRAQELLGIPWREGGRTRLGADCLGAALMMHRLLGIVARDPWAAWSERWRAGARFADLADELAGWRAVPVDAERIVGDTAVWSNGSHVAVYVGAGWWLHSTREIGTYLAEDRFVRARIASVWRPIP